MMKRDISILLCIVVTFVMPLHMDAQRSRKLKAELTFDIGHAEGTEVLVLQTLVPTDIEGRQKVESIRFSTPPIRDTYENGDRCVEFAFSRDNIPSAITITAEIEIYKDGLSTKKRRKIPEPCPDAEKYLASEKYISPDAPQIQTLAASLRGGSAEETLNNICAYLAENIMYYKSPGYSRQGNLLTLESKKGICGDYSDLMIALCRANGIPARMSGGYMMSRDFIPGWDGDKWHVWVDVYLDYYGWFPIEPSRSSVKGWKTFDPLYIYMSQDINNSFFDGYTYTYYHRGWPPRIDVFFNVR